TTHTSAHTPHTPHTHHTHHIHTHQHTPAARTPPTHIRTHTCTQAPLSQQEIPPHADTKGGEARFFIILIINSITLLLYSTPPSVYLPNTSTLEQPQWDFVGKCLCILTMALLIIFFTNIISLFFSTHLSVILSLSP